MKVHDAVQTLFLRRNPVGFCRSLARNSGCALNYKLLLFVPHTRQRVILSEAKSAGAILAESKFRGMRNEWSETKPQRGAGIS